jgi:hypothetical protein
MNFTAFIWICKHFPITAGTLQKLPGINFGGIFGKMPEYESTAFHKSASKKISGTLPNCLQNHSRHFAKIASKNFSSILP